MAAKLIELNSKRPDLFPNKLPVEMLREIWNDEQEEFTDDQLLKLRDWLYILVEEIFRRVREEKIQLEPKFNLKHDETKESDFVCPGEYGRAV